MNNENRTIWIVEWTYSPPDYFEKRFRIDNEQYKLTIQNGKVEAIINAEHGDPRPELRDQLTTYLSFMFIGIQLISHKLYELSRSSVYCRHPDGKRVIFLEPEPIVVTTSVSADLTITDRNGNVIADSRSERIEKKRCLAILAATHSGRDLTARRILQSYNNSVKDPDNELIHLYEIREALAEAFKGKKQAINALKVNKAQWQELGQLANDTPLRQGRHRGKKLSELRDATKNELNTARDIASEMIVNYLKYLEEQVKNND
ncbi:MAG: hypothetical protein WBC22_14005 [Sedimentisphaerales bacterium]